MKKQLQLLIILCFTICNLAKATDYSGDITTATTWSGEVFLTGDINISDGGSLTIEAGTTVKANGWYAINVTGTAYIVAEGTVDNPITFTNSDPTNYTTYSEDDESTDGAWHGIRFTDMDEDADSSKFEYCNFSYAKAVGSSDNNYYGGAIYVYASSSTQYDQLSFTSCCFTNNSGYRGGAIYLKYSDASIVNCSFTDNSAGYSGGSLYIDHSEISIINCNLINNSAKYGGGIYNYWSKPYLYNCILRDNTASSSGDQICNAYSTYAPLVYYSNIEGGNTFDATTYKNCIDADPLFTDADNDDYSLQSTSPCINGGDTIDISAYIPETDLLGNTRIYQSYIDIGITEYQEDIAASISGVATYEDGSVLANTEIYSGIITDDSGNFSIETGSNNIELGDTLILDSPEGYGFYPSRLILKSNTTTDIIAYKGIVVDTAYATNSTISWSADTINVFTDVDLDDAALTISAGVKVKFHDWYSINLSGTSNIIAEGTVDAPIIFMPADTTNYTTYRESYSSTDDAWHGIHFTDMDADADSSKFTYCEFSYGKSVYSSDYSSSGGAIYVYASSSAQYNQLSFTSCTFTNNSGNYGGALYLYYSNAKITNCYFSNNSCANFGGAAYLDNSDATIVNSLVTGNSAYLGGGFYLQAADANIINCTIANNTAISTSGKGKGGGIANNYSSPNLYNCIIRNNTADSYNQMYYSGSTTRTLSIYNCNIEGGNTFDAEIYENCMDEDAMFTDADNDDYSLQSTSPCINMGDTTDISGYIPETDILGNTRIYQTYIDMGAIESQETITSVSGVASYYDGSAVANQEIYSGVTTDSDGNFTIDFGDGIELADTLIFTSPEGFGFYPSRVSVKTSFNLTAYAGAVVDTTYTEGSSVTWSADTINVFMDVDLTNVSLTINAGTKVKFYDWYRIKVSEEGSINAQGTVDEPIIFVPNDTTEFTTYEESSTSTDGAWYGIYFYDMDYSADSSLFTHCQFSYAKSLGSGSAVRVSGFNDLNFTSCSFTNNSSSYGGGMYLYNSDVSIINCSFTDNSSQKGGAIYMSYSNATIANCNFIANTATSKGGAVANLYGTPEFYNTIIYNNVATTSDNQFYNVSTSYLPSIYNCNIEGGNTFDATVYENCIDADPLFTDADNGDYSLQSTSPCINAGDATDILSMLPETDLLGNTRIYQSYIDMGTIEYQEDIVPTISVTALYEDGSAVTNHEIYAGITTDDSGNFTLETGSNNIAVGDTLVLNAPEGYGFYPSRILIKSDETIDLTAYAGAVVDTSYSQSSSITWSADTINIFMDVDLDNTSLIIAAGTKVKFYDWYSVNLSGSSSIVAQGTADDPIIFMPADTTDYTTYTEDDESTDDAWHGIRFTDMNADADSSKFEYCEFSYAKACSSSPDYYGGAIYVYASSSEQYNQLSFTSCSFTNNSGSYGGAMYLYYSDASIINCNLTNNSGYRGGAMYLKYADASIINSNLIDNCASNNGDGIYNYRSTPKLYNCIIRYNAISSSNNLIYNYSSSYLPSVYNCNIEGGNTFSATTYENCMDADPLFTDADNGDYSLQSTSPCINTGDATDILSLLPATDLLGNTRVYQSFIDMGVIEYQEDVVVTVSGVASYEDGSVLANYEIYSGITTDDSGNFSIETGSDNIVVGDTLLLNSPDGYGFYPSKVTLQSDDVISLTAYKGIVVDTSYTEGSTIAWSSDTVNVFTDVDLTNSSLTINAGTKVKFHDCYAINLSESSSLVAQGTADEAIIFMPADTTGFTTDDPSNPTKGGWAGIHFKNMSADADTSKFEYCTLQFVKEDNGSDVGAIGVTSASQSYFNQLQISNCSITNNKSVKEGTGISLEYSNPQIVNCIISNNVADWFGAGMFLHESDPLIINCLFTNNTTSEDASAIFAFNSSPQLYNTIIYNNPSSGGNPIHFEPDTNIDTIAFYNCNIEGDAIDVATYENCINTDPIFTDADNSDYSLQSTSPCINAGTISGISTYITSYDIIGSTRICGDAIDMGIYEYYEESISTDINSTNKVTFNMYPNPASESVTIEGDDLNGAYIYVMNIAGQNAVSEESNSTSKTLNVSDLPTGTYIVLIKKEGEIIASEKLIKK